MTLAVVCRGSRYFLEPLLAHWQEKYTLVKQLEHADAVFVEWANEQVVGVTRQVVRPNVVCRVLGSEYYQEFWKQADPDKLFAYASENPDYEFPGFRSEFVPEHVDTEFWAPAGEPEPGSLLLVGRYTYWKNHLGLLRMLAGWPERFRVTMVGEQFTEDPQLRMQSKRVRHQLLWLAGHAGIRLDLMDEVPPEKLRDLYRCHEYVVSTSLHEGCQTVPQEAMACGCKVLVQRWMGAERIYPEDNLFTSEAEFWQKVETVAPARQAAVDRWSRPVVFARLDELLEEAARAR